MLLPSDVARLVLGYLQEEGLSATSQAFIRESPNLKEYAEHTTGDGTIPACVFSVFGKSLTTILNEYVAVKAKESCLEVPVVMTSLWKKLDFTLNQIKSMQNSPAISACQRTRSRIGVANMARQRVLTVASGGGMVCSSVSETSSVISSAHTSSSILGTSTPVSYTALPLRPVPGSGTHQQLHDGNRLLNTPKDTPVQIVISENRLNPGPLSPGRRKWDTPRKRSGALGGSTGTGRSTTAVSSLNAEPQPEEVVDENFPQLVIQNARDKILGDRSLQEKLAENINKILANEPTPQTSKSSTVEAEQSIDEILGLQGEIHMSDDAIHDILEQTESDPAFQALFDLFDYNKTRFADGETGDGDVSSSPEESDTAGPSSTIRPFPIDDPGTMPRDANVSDTTQQTMKTRAGQDRKTRKSAAPILLKKTALGPSGRASRIENSSAKLLVRHEEPRSISTTPVNVNRKDNSNHVGVTQMDIGQLHTPSPSMDIIAAQELPTKDSTSTPTSLSEPTAVPSSGVSAAFTAPAVTSASTVDKKQECKQAEQSKEQAATTFSSVNQPPFLSPLQVEMNNTTVPSTVLPHTSISCSGGDSQSVSTVSVTLESAPSTLASSNSSVIAAPASSAYTAAPFTAAPSLPPFASASATVTPAPASAASSSCAPVTAAPDLSTTNSGAPANKAAADSGNVVSLKIIISDNQDEDSSNDVALNQAISSISGDKIPTIYLSSPAKSFGVPGTPKTTLDEVAQAVSGLQSSEAHASPLSSSKAGALVTSPLTGTSQAQQSYIIQLPLDTTNPALQGATASYFFVTEPPTTDAQSRQVLLPTGVSKEQPLPTNQYGVTTPPCSQGYSAESAVIYPSPVKPMMLPVSVMGQNTVGNVQLVSNQLVAIQNPVLVPQSETVKPKPLTVAVGQSTTTGTEQKQVDKVISPVLSENTGQQDAVKGSNHRRILVFDSSAEVQPQTATTTRTTTPPPANTSTSQSFEPTEKDNTQPAYRRKPTILGGNKPKRRVEIVRCSADPQTGGGLVKEVEKSISSQQHQKDPLKKNSRKQDHNIHNREFQNTSASRVDISQTETSKIPESGDMSKFVNRKPAHDKRNDEVKAQDSYTSRPLSSDSALKSGSNNDKEESSRKESTEKPLAKSREGRADKRTTSQEMPNVTANKENEIKSTLSAIASRDFGSPTVTQSSANTQCMATKAPSKTSSLVKQAAEMLQDIQGLNCPSTPVRRPGACSSECSLPRTAGAGQTQEESADCQRTPSQQKKCKDGEGTPKHLMPPNAQDVPNCSPASEAGSENSINMAAHTLMILSRAAIARTGTPLKDSLRQEGVAEKSPTSSKNAKKRKQSSPTGSPPAKKESKRSPGKKKDRERKKLMDCFPHDLDVDKFLSSLHYDE
ncbi:protein NPAT [Mastacembelus armatus]|uniref:Nuclear protein, ataxia-telangiectasia locus n=1 Tax=Mastacembelus armatus TaxID=205130 RepID=A0A3Q3L7I4_9TELE|nr:protein NPAT [Mastacembelus armatus]